jgi:hypothetical protein
MCAGRAAAEETVVTKKPIVWGLSDALELVRSIQPALHAMKWHVALGGGVLNVGESTKDLDLFFLPFDDATQDNLMPYLVAMWGGSEPLSANADNYPPSKKWARKVKFTPPFGRIDAFIAEAA